MKQAYLDISKQLKTALPDLHIDFFRNQIRDQKKEFAYTAPLVLVEFQNVKNDGETSGVRRGTANLILHVAERFIGDTSHLASDQDEALSFFDLSQRVDLALVGISTQAVSQVTQTGIEYDKNPDVLYVTKLSYTMRFVDTSILDARGYIEARPDVRITEKKNAPNRVHLIQNPNP